MKEFDEEQQEHVNSLVSSSKAKIRESVTADFTTQLGEKDTKLSTATARITELEAQVKSTTDLNASTEDWRKAQALRSDQQDADMKTLR